MHILVTGTGRGIGYQTAISLLENTGNTIIALSRNDASLQKLQSVAATLKKSANFIPLPFDLEAGDPVKVKEFVQSRCGRLDVLVNNAATIIVKPFLELKEEDFRAVYGLNVFKTVSLIRELVPLMERKDQVFSHIVNISSMGGFQGSVKFPGLSAYSSSKAALCSLSESLAEELKEKRIAVNCLCLGAVQTEMLGQAFPGYKAPLEAREMADYIAHFAETGARYFNGKILPVSLSTP